MRIAFTPWGSLGDLHPYLAIAMEMKRRGNAVSIATSEVYREKVEGEGIEFHAVRPDLRPFLDQPGRFAAFMDKFRGPEEIFGGVVMPSLRDMFQDLCEGVRGSDLLVSHLAMCAAPVAAEYLSIPWVSVALQPAALWSVYDPPYLPIFGRLPKLSSYAAQPFVALVRAMTNRWMQPAYALRRELGMPANGRHPLFEWQFSQHTLAWFSPAFGTPQPDWPRNTVATGFPFYDKLDSAASDLSPEMEEFLAVGAPPVVFTLGSSAVHVPSDFYEISFQVAQGLNRRAILLAGPDFPKRTRLKSTKDVLVTDYAPYSKLLPRAAATVHSGGIGTTAQALRSGRPQIVMPFSHDQPDNGDRVRRLGCGPMIPRNRYSVRRVSRELERLLHDGRVLARAQELGRIIQAENGVSAAADALEKLLRRDSPTGLARKVM